MADGGSVRRWQRGEQNVDGLTTDHTAARPWRELHRRLVAGIETVFTWIERSRQRRQLAALSDHSLKDLDISPADAEAEYRKYFWQA